MKLPHPGPSSLLDTLTDINVDDLLDSAGLTWLRRTSLRHLFRPAARRFAQVAHEFDQRVGECGLAQGSAWVLRRMTTGLDVSGADHIPATGPVFVLANHPGMTDTVALFTSLASRADLRVIARDSPFLRALPNVARQLIFVPDDDDGRMAVVRAGAKHLKQGGALLTFPAGEIEPDPAVFGQRRAVESLQRWSDSFTLFARLVPQTRCVPALVSNVISSASQRHPFTWLRRTAQGKEKLATTLQVALPRYQTMVARVTFGPSICAADAGSLKSAITAQVRHLIEMSARAEHAEAAFGETLRVAEPQHAEATRCTTQRLGTE